jgi:hypothetical protein
MTEETYMPVTAQELRKECPFLFDSLREVAGDAGVVGAGTYMLPRRTPTELAEIENALAELPLSLRAHFCVGEESEQLRILKDSKALTDAHQLLNDFFDGPMIVEAAP